MSSPHPTVIDLKFHREWRLAEQAAEDYYASHDPNELLRFMSIVLRMPDGTPRPPPAYPLAWKLFGELGGVGKKIVH